MACLFEHNWGWPRKRGSKDIQVCLNCGLERESRVRFDGPRYTRTQNPSSNFSTLAGQSGSDAQEPTPLPSAA
jgi:hypothetical protein